MESVDPKKIEVDDVHFDQENELHYRVISKPVINDLKGQITWESKCIETSKIQGFMSQQMKIGDEYLDGKYLMGMIKVNYEN